MAQPRQRALFAKFGRKPNLVQQLQFLFAEMTGGKEHGAGVLRSHNAYDAMTKYVNDFMRPNFAGAAGDIIRRTSYLRNHPASGDTHHYHIRSTDPKAVACEIEVLHNRKRRHAIAQAHGIHS